MNEKGIYEGMFWKGPTLLNRDDVRTSLKNALLRDKRTYITANLMCHSS